MNSGASDNARLQKELTFRKALVRITNELLSSKLELTFYQTALERTVALVPTADAGSVMARHEDGMYHFQAALYRLVLEHQLEEERERYEHMAHHDPLTGLANRRLFMESLRRANVSVAAYGAATSRHGSEVMSSA